MNVFSCPKCGGQHWGQHECPYTTEQIERMGQMEDIQEGAPAKKFTIIAPTVGRVVDFRSPSPGYSARMGLSDYGRQPMDAHIVYVHSNRCVNVAGFDHEGKPFRSTSVRLIQEGDRPQGDDEAVCTWMEYQIGQAKKYEQLATQQEAMQTAQAAADTGNTQSGLYPDSGSGPGQ